MERKIDWVSLNPRTARNRLVKPDEAAEDFHRDVGTLGIQAQRNHAKLTEYVRQLDALRRGEA